MRRLIQIRHSHNCIKVRRALEAKGLEHETLDIPAPDRTKVVAASGQSLVPVLIDGERVIPESTAILRHLEASYREPSLLPSDPARHSECWLIESWADVALMALTRRIAYWQVLKTPARLAPSFFPSAGPRKARVMMVVARRVLTKRFGLSERQNARDEREVSEHAAVAVERLGGRTLLFDRLTVADLTLAAMAAPLWLAAPHVRDEPAVRALLEAGRGHLGPEVLEAYGALWPPPSRAGRPAHGGQASTRRSPQAPSPGGRGVPAESVPAPPSRPSSTGTTR